MAAPKKMAVILIRGLQNIDGPIRNTMKMLNLNKRNICIIIPASASLMGMVVKVKNYITYGEVSEETLKLLKDKKGESDVYHLNSPRKGYGRKGIKRDFHDGGALGYRAEKINDLIQRMI